jgi:predicted PurR-regulated permease PerM
LFFTALTKQMTPFLSGLTLAAVVSIALTPVLTRYRGYFSSKLSGLGFTAEVVVDGRKEQN